VQTFPPDFKWDGTKTDMEQMIGNAVPVKLAEFVASALASHIAYVENTYFTIHIETIDYSDFYSWLIKNHTFSERGRSDVMSRLRRALSICDADCFPDKFYRFQLEQSSGFQSLSPAVRSQVKKAVSLYSEYYNERYGELKLAI
jgi:DNA (cytosine-5)-methyltransferase 1